MIKTHEVKSIIRGALEELNGQEVDSKLCHEMLNIMESSVEEDEDGNLIFSFKEDFRSSHTDKYKISIECCDTKDDKDDDKNNKLIFPHTIQDITFYNVKELIEWVENQREFNDKNLYRIIKKDEIIQYLLDILEEEHMGMRTSAIEEINNKFGTNY